VLDVVLVGLAVGLADWLEVGATLVGLEGLALALGVALTDDEADERPVGVALTDEEEDERPVGVALAEEDADERPVGLALAEALLELLGDPAGSTAESSRIAAFGRLEQAPFTMGGCCPGRTEAPKTLELEARSMKPVSALSVTGRTSRAFTGTASSWTSLPLCNCPPWSSQYAYQD
jgi:hypothetical protein